MNAHSRTVKSVRNVVVGVTTQAFLMILGFIARSVFVTQLGLATVGMNALFMSILAVLALTDLGLSSAIAYSLYRPLSDGDEGRISALVRMCASIYRYVAIAVAVLGLAIAPFLDHLIGSEDLAPDAPLYYLILLANSIVSYLMAHRTVLLLADQKMYLVSLYNFACTTARSLAQITALVIWHSYLVFVVLQVLFTLINNAAVFVDVGRRYPYLKTDHSQLERSERKSVVVAVRAMLVYRVGGVILNNTDPILISSIVGTVALGRYSNYMLLVGSMMIFTELAFGSASAGIGSLAVTVDRQRRVEVFQELNLVAAWVFGSLAIGIYALSSEFVELWLGPEFVLSRVAVAAIALNFFMSGIMTPVAMYRAATGMFKQTQYVFIATAALNLALSMTLGFRFGIAGILFATAISRLVTNLWFEPWVLFRHHFSGKANAYYRSMLGRSTAIVLGAALIDYWGDQVDHLGPSTVTQIILVLLMPNLAFIWVYRQRPEFRALKARFWEPARAAISRSDMHPSRKGPHL